MQDGKSLKAALATDFDQVAEQIVSLREELASLAQAVAANAEKRGRFMAATAEKKGRSMAADLTDGISDAVKYVERRGVNGEAEVEKTISAHPLMALAIAAGAGLMIGALSRR